MIASEHPDPLLQREPFASLDLVELIMELEDQFGVKISDEDAQSIQTVGQAVDYIAARS